MLHSRSWFKTAFMFRGSVIPSVLPRVIACGIFAEIVFGLQSYFQTELYPHILGNLGFVLNVVLSLLLVFRTNTAYERFWEGRKAWGTLVNTIRNLARTLIVTIAEPTAQDKSQKIAALHLLIAYASSLKQHLREECLEESMQNWVSTDQFTKLQQVSNAPLEIALWIGDYAQKQFVKGYLHVYSLNFIHGQINIMVDVLGICERIQKTPIPLAYSIHLKQILLIYCLLLPFQIVDAFGWLTGLFAAMISFVLLGIEEIGVEIEDPFGKDPNDLPLDNLCQTIIRNIKDLINVTPAPQLLTECPPAFDPIMPKFLTNEVELETTIWES